MFSRRKDDRITKTSPAVSNPSVRRLFTAPGKSLRKLGGLRHDAGRLPSLSPPLNNPSIQKKRKKGEEETEAIKIGAHPVYTFTTAFTKGPNIYASQMNVETPRVGGGRQPRVEPRTQNMHPSSGKPRGGNRSPVRLPRLLQNSPIFKLKKEEKDKKIRVVNKPIGLPLW